MVADWTNIAIVCFLFAGLLMAVLGSVCAAAPFRPPASDSELQRSDLMAVLEEMGRKAAVAESILKQLSSMQGAARTILEDQEAHRSMYRMVINGHRADLHDRRPVLAGPAKRR